VTVDQRFGICAGLTIFDAAATFVAVGMLGGVELNPLLATMIGEVGLAATMGLRAAVGVVAVGFLTLRAHDPNNRLGVRPLRWVTVLLGLLAGWHVVQFALFLI